MVLWMHLEVHCKVHEKDLRKFPSCIALIQVNGVAVGDWVVPLAASQGTWRETGVFDSNLWHKVPSTLPLECAASLAIK